MAARRILSLMFCNRTPTQTQIPLFHECACPIHPFTTLFFTRHRFPRRGNQTLANPAIAEDSKDNEDKKSRPVSVSVDIPSLENKDDSCDVKYSVLSNLKVSPRHDLAMMFTCKVCETRSIKTVSRESYETGVVVVRCGGCNNLHLMADHLGWFGEPGSVESFLAARGEEVQKGSIDSLNLILEDLAGKQA